MITHSEKILWHIRCNYFSMLPSKQTIISPWTNTEVITYIRSKEQWDFLHRAYFFCTHEKIFNNTFEKFREYLLKEYYPNPYKRSRRSGWWSYPRFYKSRYKRKVEHFPKVLSKEEQSRKDWREYKKLKKDKSKKHHRSYSRKQDFSKISNRKHRRWVKQRIYHQKWDLSDMEYKLFCDPRLWD